MATKKSKPGTAQKKKPKDHKEKIPKEKIEKKAMQKPLKAAQTTSSKKSSSTGSQTKSFVMSNLTPETGRTICRVIGCTLPATTNGYSRNCYIKYWKQIKKKQDILKQGVLDKYIREIVEKYPEKVVLAIRQDLVTDDNYAQMIRELDLYGGVDELEHEMTLGDDEGSMDEVIEDIKKDITKEEEDF